MADTGASEDSEHGPLTLLDLPHEDILHQFFRYLPLSSLFYLRGTCNAMYNCVNHYFATMHSLNLTHVSPRFGGVAFDVITRNSHNLRMLNIRNSKDWLTDSVLIPVLAQNPLLEKVDMANCSCLRHLSVAKLSSCPGLKELSFRECQWLAPESLMQLVWSRGASFEKLDLSGCWGINDHAVIAIASCCKNLQSLSLSKIYGITDYSMIEVAKNCRNLRHLNITNCWRVTDEAIKLLGEYCKDLHMLQIQQCRDVTEISLARLRARGVKMDVPKQRYQINKNHLDFLRTLKIQI